MSVSTVPQLSLQCSLGIFLECTLHSRRRVPPKGLQCFQHDMEVKPGKCIAPAGGRVLCCHSDGKDKKELTEAGTLPAVGNAPMHLLTTSAREDDAKSEDTDQKGD